MGVGHVSFYLRILAVERKAGKIVGDSAKCLTVLFDHYSDAAWATVFAGTGYGHPRNDRVRI